MWHFTLYLVTHAYGVCSSDNRRLLKLRKGETYSCFDLEQFQSQTEAETLLYLQHDNNI